MVRHPTSMTESIAFFSDSWHIAASLAAFALAVSGVPQALRVWRSRSAEDVSAATWLLVWASMLVLTAYIWATVEDIILRTQYVFGSVVNTVIVSGIFRFRKPH